jgi:type I restriction-modification system DNA methylase subunit
MARKAHQAPGVETSDDVNGTQLELIKSSNYNPFWSSSLFNEVYLLNDVPQKFKELWDFDEAGHFYEFCNHFRNLCEELQGADLESWSEKNTINRFIKPVLKMLGYEGTLTQDPWAEDETFTVTEGGENKTYKPDLILVNDPKELKYIEKEKGQRKLEEARQSVIVPVEAKYWGRIEDKESSQQEDRRRADKKTQTDSSRGMEFDEQCLKYMEVLQKDFGILTDGRTWRLYHKELSNDNYKRNFQFNLGHLMRHVNAGLDEDSHSYEIFLENAKYFYHIFSKEALYSDCGERPFLNDLLEYSKKYVSAVEEDLKLRFVKAMATACNGFQRAIASDKSVVDLDTIRNVSESHLFNILFIRYCESKSILPMRDHAYRKISLSVTIDKLRYFNPKKEQDNLNYPMLKRVFKGHFHYSPDGTELYDRLMKLTKIVQNGSKSSDNGFEIKGFRESIFNKDELCFVRKYKLSNSEMASIFYELGYCESAPGKYQQIPYNFFSPRQLGSIYESFLEFKLEKASEDMALMKGKWAPAALKSEKMKALDVPKVKRGMLFFSPNNADRKMTGSYYTPECVVQYIVRETLTPLVSKKTSKEIANIRVCDPAMGSGHFLGGALNFLARSYLAALEKETNDDLMVNLRKAKRMLLPNCIYGVDINSRAVKLAKMSLWLDIADASERLENLDGQIKCADSLNDEDLWKKEWRFLSGGIDAVVGNPPYLGEKGNKEIFQKVAQGWLGKRFYLGKMDLFYFFFHLGLDILADGGRLGFITTNYYPTASGARKLREDFYDRSNLDLLVNLNELKVFGEAAGQHNLITVLEKTKFDMGTRIILSDERGDVSSRLLTEIHEGIKTGISSAVVKKKDLYDGEKKYIRLVSQSNASNGSELESILEKLKAAEHRLSDVGRVNTGIMGGCDHVTKLNSSYVSKDELQLKNIQIGDGVFCSGC